MFVLAIRLQHIFKMFSRRLWDALQKRLLDVFKMSCQDIFKASSKRLQEVLKNVFRTSSRCLQDVLKTSSRNLQDLLQRYLEDVSKTYHQVKLFLLTLLWEAFNTFLRRSFPKTVIYRGICLGNTISDKLMVGIQNLQEK